MQTPPFKVMFLNKQFVNVNTTCETFELFYEKHKKT